jgi:hypothetical protein
VAVLAMHLILQQLFNITPVAATRTAGGLLLQVLCGAVGGWVFVRLLRVGARARAGAWRVSDSAAAPSGARLARALDAIERVGNRLPDPALLFFLLLIVVWVLSALLAQFAYQHIDPRTGAPIEVVNLLEPGALTTFLGGMVNTFVTFHPLGVVLLAMLGIGVADHTGFIKAALRALLSVTSPRLLTPMLLFIAIVSHTAVDAGYVLVIPLGAVIFQAAGRHPAHRHRRRLRRRVRRLQRQLRAVGAGSDAAGHQPGGCAADRPRRSS